MARRRCLGCSQLTSAGSYCSACRAQRKRVYNGDWQRISREARAAQPWCSKCGSTEDLTVDHVAPRSLAAGVDVLCRACNGRKADR